MSYRNLIDSNLKRAFSMIKDLATDVTFIRKQGVDYDFNTAAATPSSTSTFVIKAVILDSKKKSEDHNTMSKEIMFKTKELIDITIYDSIVIGNDTWKIGPIISNSGFIILANIFKEV